MNVLFDIAVLGSSNAFAHSRTGIFRVVEHLAHGLHAAADCGVSFCTSQCNFQDCRTYLDADPELAGSRLSRPGNPLASIYNYVEPLRLYISRLPQQSWKSPVRTIYHRGKEFISPIDMNDVKRADIFHAPANAIPHHIVWQKQIKKFITIHDLIPVLHPEYCHPSNIAHMKVILESIKPDTFVICVSESTRQDLLNHMPFLDPALVTTVHLAAGNCFYPCSQPERREQIKVKYDIPPDNNYLLALSTLQPRKNFEHIITSFIRLLKEEQIKDLNLVLVGAEGWDYDNIYQRIAMAGELSKKIILTGYVPDEDLAPLYSASSAFIYPSLYEGFGLPLLEAMQCGTPVITANNSSLPEVTGEAAILIDARDGDALCQAMLEIYRDADLRNKLSAMSLKRAEMFHWDKTINAIIANYQRALQ